MRSTIEAWQVGYENLKELADRVHGKAHQTIRSASGAATMDISLTWRDVDGEMVRLGHGDYVVLEQDGFYHGWGKTAFEANFEPTQAELIEL